MLRRCFALIASLLSLATFATAEGPSAWDGSWFESRSGGSLVDVPSFLDPARDFMVNGESHGTAFDAIGVSSFWLQQFSTEPTSDRPYYAINERLSGAITKITYSVDRADLGVISGYKDDKLQVVFYDICKPSHAYLICLSMGWDTKDHDNVEPLIDRIVHSFRQADSGPVSTTLPDLGV